MLCQWKALLFWVVRLILQSILMHLCTIYLHIPHGVPVSSGSVSVEKMIRISNTQELFFLTLSMLTSARITVNVSCLQERKWYWGRKGTLNAHSQYFSIIQCLQWAVFKYFLYNFKCTLKINFVPKKHDHKLALNQKPTVLHALKTSRTWMPKKKDTRSLKKEKQF